MRHNWPLAVLLLFAATAALLCSGQTLPQPFIPRTTNVEAKLVREYKTEFGTLIRVYQSPEQWSGHGKNSSDWYVMKVPPSPAGYRLSRQSFELRGDRNCFGNGEGVQTRDLGTRPMGKADTLSLSYFSNCAWSKVALVERDESGVAWMFQMQGHEERKKLVFDHVTFAPNFEIGFRIEGDAATSVGLITVAYVPLDHP